MKALLFFILFKITIVSCQEINKNKTIFVTIGKPWHPDLNKNLNTLSLSVSFQNKFAENFAYESFYTFAKSNNYPVFFNDKIKLREYLLSQKGYNIVSNSAWSDIYTHSLGAKIHYAFVNNTKWFFSFNFSLGYFFSKSSIFEVEHFKYNPQTEEIYSYDSSLLEDDISSFFIGPGIQVNYFIKKRYIIGLDLNAHFSQLSNQKFNKIPEIPNYYNLAIILGVKL